MSDPSTTHLALPLLAAAQAQKHVTHNDALLRLDAVVQTSVLAMTLTEPPASPTEECHQWADAEYSSPSWRMRRPPGSPETRLG